MLSGSGANNARRVAKNVGSKNVARPGFDQDSKGETTNQGRSISQLKKPNIKN